MKVHVMMVFQSKKKSKPLNSKRLTKVGFTIKGNESEWEAKVFEQIDLEFFRRSVQWQMIGISHAFLPD